MAKRNYQTEFHPETIREIRESIQWYRDRNEPTADELRLLVESAESLIERSPESIFTTRSAIGFKSTRSFLPTSCVAIESIS